MCRKGNLADKIRPEEAKEAKITETHTGMFLKKISEKLERLANGDAGRRDITFSQGKVLWFLHKRENEGVTTMRDIEKFFDCRVFLQTWVKVKEDWRNRAQILQNFGYDEKNFD